jgi:ribonuclease E
MEEEAIKDRSVEVRAIVPVDVAAYLLNEKRAALSEIETVTKARMLVIPNPNLETPHFEVQRLRDDEVDGDHETSYKVDIAAPDVNDISDSHSAAIPQQQAAVQSIAPRPPAPAAAEKPAEATPTTKQESKPKSGLLARLWAGVTGAEPEKEPEEAKPAPRQAKSSPQRQGQGQGQGRKPQGNRNRNRRRGGQGRSQEGRSSDERRKDTRGQDDREQQKSERSEDSGRGGSGRGRPRRRSGGDPDGQRRRPEAVEDTSNDAQQPVSAEATDSGDKPRKRPSDMKRGQPQRRRRNRGRKPDAESAVAAEASTTDSNLQAQDAPVESPVVEAAEAVVAAVPVAPTAQATESAPAELVSEAPQAEVESEEAQVTPDVAEVTETVEAPEVAAVPEAAEVAETAEIAEVAEIAKDTIATTVAEEKAPAPVETAPEPAPVAAVQEEVIEEAGSTDGITADGRACNDPRVDAQPIGVVEITTTHPALFGDSVAPPVAPSGRTAPRASNDPRGPLPEAAMAEAAG